MGKNEYVTHVESTIRWDSHKALHELEESSAKNIREMHAKAHEREHAMTEAALTKAETMMDRRLETMNEFREQLNRQANTFVTREMFDKYTQDLENKIDFALSSSGDKSDALAKSLVNRHDSDFNNLRDTIQGEREIRKANEGSISTWKWIAGFLGASGVAGIIVFLASKGT